MEIKFRTPYMIRLRDGTECLAEFIRLNKHCGKKEVWKRFDDVPRKKKYIEKKDVIAIAAWKV